MQKFGMTTWENSTTHTQRFELHSGPGAEPHRIEVPPGKCFDLPSMYDDAICTTRDGVVVGGLAPLLVAKGRKQVPVHEAIATAARKGDEERKLVEATGASPGGARLDAMAALQAKNEALEAKLKEQDLFNAALMAKLDALMNATPAKESPKEQPKGGGKPPANQSGSPPAPQGAPAGG